MNYEKLLRENLIKKQIPDFAQISKQLKRAEQDIETAVKNLKIDITWSITIAYHAMIRAGRALMYAKGYLPTTKNTHKTIVDFTKITFGNEYEVLISKFNRLRKQRHDFIYESKNHITRDEAEAAINVAKMILKEIKNKIKKENPQKELF